MAGAQLPIKFQEHLQLTTAGISEENIAFASLTLESDKFIAVREKKAGKNECVIISMANPSAPQRREMSADNVIMNPAEEIIALRSGKVLQVFNLATKTKLKACTIGDDVAFWTWIDDKTVGIVTSKEVFHWTLDGNVEGAPVKVFDRHERLATTQIISYSCNADKKMVLSRGHFRCRPARPWRHAALLAGKETIAAH